ncbi:Trehalase [Seminavis robusta]|uniref:Trehalase n=1 Tax=Seminavis robusta TaxID=568900 RepID=A0A9N8DLW4_9STRA|nr:Trehalase [Seminavis robusta]|eukprot:Sro215_g088950.1 Trehalase (876) ;mRNA; r:23316-26112
MFVTAPTLLFAVLCLFKVFVSGGTAAEATPGLAYHLYENAALAGTPSATGITTSVELSLDKQRSRLVPNSDTESKCYLSGELVGTIEFPTTDKTEVYYTFDCQFAHTSTGWVWVDGHVVCGDRSAFNYSFPAIDNPLPIRRKRSFPFRARITSNQTACDNIASVKVNWKSDATAVTTNDDEQQQNQPSFRLLEHDESSNGIALSPRLPPSEETRDRLQRSLLQGWGSWLRFNMISVVKLPEGLLFTPRICQLSTNKCFEVASPETDGVRVDLHAYDRSYVGYNLTLTQPQVSLSMEYAVSGERGETLQYLITVLDAPGDKNDFIVDVAARFAWFRPGTISTTTDDEGNLSLTFATNGLGTTNLTIVAERPVVQTQSSIGLQESRRLQENPSSGKSFFSFRLSGGKGSRLGFVAGMTQKPSLDQLQATLKTNKAKEYQRLETRFGPAKAPVAEAIQCAAMWTVIYNPIENGPLMPVSRSRGWSFQKKSGATTEDWTYVIFDWDNLFASLLAGLDNKEVAYSNLFQVVKSKTAQGFIPNYAGGGVKSQDRTEPPVGAKVVLELYRKYKEKWPVEVVFDDLLDWNNWFVANRMLQPEGIVALGSFWEGAPPHPDKGPDTMNSMQAARFESGLDNSPMYDGEIYDKNGTHLMQLYDVGMASLFAQEAYSLGELADIIGRDPKLGTMLRKRADDMRDKIQKLLWDSQQRAFANLYPNGTFSHHISPTSFYPLGLGAASDEQVQSMMGSWMLNSSRFCITPEGDFQGNDPNVCYWGLPSISADDPTYMKANFIYWRGYSWGPMAQLVYWSLQGPKQSDIVSKAKKALCKQMESLVMSQWNLNRHICENYHPHKNASDCSGTRYYHWGALNGLIGMVEDGYW